MEVNGIYELNVYFDGKGMINANDQGTIDSPDTNQDALIGSFVSARIYESIENPIPSCEVECIFVPIFFNKGLLKDGTRITFKIENKLFKTEETLTFRLYNIKKLALKGPYLHVILEGLADFYNGYTDGNVYNFYGTSSKVFDNIATQNGLESSIDTTSDTQLWVAGQNNVYEFMNFVSKHGWAGKASGMFWCMDRQRRLLYKDIQSLFRNRSDNIYTFYQTPKINPSKNQFQYDLIDTSLMFGTNNIKNDGYGTHDYSFNLEKYELEDISATSVCPENNCLCISEELSQGLNYNWEAFDVGNFHKNYIKAAIQNKRVLATYGTHTILNCQYFQPFRLCQIVNLVYSSTRTDEQSKYFNLPSLSTVYMIDAIKINISLKNIWASVGLVTQGLNVEKGNNYGAGSNLEKGDNYSASSAE